MTDQRRSVAQKLGWIFKREREPVPKMKGYNFFHIKRRKRYWLPKRDWNSHYDQIIDQVIAMAESWA